MTATGVMIEFFRKDKQIHYSILVRAKNYWKKHSLDESPELFVDFLQKFYGDLVESITNDLHDSFTTRFVSAIVTSQISNVDWIRFAKVIMTEYEKDKKL